MNSSKKKKSEPGLIATFSSIQFGLVVLISIVVVAMIGTVIHQGRSIQFYDEHYGDVVNSLIRVFRLNNTYRSPLFIGLLGLFGMNLVLCSLARFTKLFRKTFMPDRSPNAEGIAAKTIKASIESHSLENVQSAFKKAGFPLHRVDDTHLFGEKGRLGYLGAFIVHLSLLVLLLGGIISLATGQRGYVSLQKGDSASKAFVDEEKTFPLGFEVKLDSFNVAYYDNFHDRPKSFTSSVTVTHPDGRTIKKDIRVNHPLMLNNLTIYQSSYGDAGDRQIMSASGDTALITFSLKGAPESMPPVKTLDMVIGEEYLVPVSGDSFKVRLAELHRNFRRGSSPSDTLGPVVKVDIIKPGEKQWSVYAFRDFPGYNMPIFNDLDLVFSMLVIKMSGKEKDKGEQGEYYTVLGVVKDRGIPVIWAGSVLIIIGLFLSFYIRPRRVWILKENSAILLGALVKRNPLEFKEVIKKSVKQININWEE